jgi:hypothetical protein
MEGWETPYGKVALAFATALVSGKFEDAHALLSSAMAEDWSPSALKATYDEMVEYFSTPPDLVRVEAVMTDWPDKQPEDIGWAYTTIACDGEGEAVTVIVYAENGKNLIRDIEWGRP